MATIEKAKTLREIRRICRPMPLKGDELEAFFVETDSARDPHQRTRQLLYDALDMGEDIRLLFYGHRGCGKSTELNKFISERTDMFFTVTFSVLREMSPVAVRAEDLILIIADRVLNAAVNAELSVDEKLLKPVLDYFTETTQTTKESRDTCAGAEAGISTQGTLLGKLTGLFVKLRGEIKLNVHSDETHLAKLRKRPADLLVQANCLINAVREALPPGKRLLIIVEDLDKLDIHQARKIYVENVTLLTGITANIIYTIPVFLFHSPEVNAFRFNFDDIIALPMIKVSDPRLGRVEGFEIIQEIVCRRISDDLIEKEALAMLIDKTGGVLRHVFEVLQTTALMADVETPIRKEHVEYGLKKLQKDFWQQITLPYDELPGGPESVEDLYERLEEYGKKERQGERNPPKADAVNQILLRSCALVEYNGEGWFGVHPLVMDNLKALGRLP